jgi:hypothetical protein
VGHHPRPALQRGLAKLTRALGRGSPTIGRFRHDPPSFVALAAGGTVVLQAAAALRLVDQQDKTARRLFSLGLEACSLQGIGYGACDCMQGQSSPHLARLPELVETLKKSRRGVCSNRHNTWSEIECDRPISIANSLDKAINVRGR